MCIAIWTRVEQEATVREVIEGMSVDEQVFFVLYIAKPNHHYYYDFPVNYLRNVCIRQIKTSHFMFLDIDMWPTSRYEMNPFIIATLYQHLMQLPDTIFNNSRSTVVIPPVFLRQRKVLGKCRGLHSCFMKYFSYFFSIAVLVNWLLRLSLNWRNVFIMTCVFLQRKEGLLMYALFSFFLC